MGIWRRFIGLFIDTAADFMYCIHHVNTFEGDEVVFHGKERWSGRLWGGDTIVVARMEVELRLAIGCVGDDYGRIKMLSRNQSASIPNCVRGSAGKGLAV